MKLTVPRDVLAALTTWVAAATRTGISGPLTPVLAGVMLTADAPGALTAARFGYDASAAVRAAAEVGEPGRALVAARLLTQVVAALPAKQSVEVAFDGTRLILAAGAVRYTLLALPADEYPQIPEPGEHVAELDPKALAAAVAAVTPAASADDTLPALTCVRLRLRDGTAHLATTDRYRAALTTCPYTPGPADTPGALTEALIPARELAAVTKRPGTEPVRLAVTPETVSLSTADRHVTVRQLSGEFPDVDRLIPDPGKVTTTAIIGVAELAAAVKRAAVVAERNTPVRLALNPAEDGDASAAAALIECGTGDEASLTETVWLPTFHGEPLNIAFNPAYLLDALNAVAALDGEPLARLAMTGPVKPALITAETYGSPGALTYLLMPIKNAG